MAAELVSGRIFQLVLLMTSLALLLVLVARCKSGKLPTLRKLPAIDGIEIAVGRAAEMGRPVHYTTTQASMTGGNAQETFAGLTTLRYVATLTAKYNVPLLVSVMVPETLPLVEDIVYSSYTEAGKPEAFKKENIRFIAPVQQAFAAGVVGWLFRAKPAASMIIGEMRGETLHILTTAKRIGAVQVAGTATLTNVQFVATFVEYSFIGEEMFALDAYLSREPALIGALHAEDMVKFLVLGLLVLGAALGAANMPIINQLLRF